MGSQWYSKMLVEGKGGKASRLSPLLFFLPVPISIRAFCSPCLFHEKACLQQAGEGSVVGENRKVQAEGNVKH